MKRIEKVIWIIDYVEEFEGFKGIKSELLWKLIACLDDNKLNKFYEVTKKIKNADDETLKNFIKF